MRSHCTILDCDKPPHARGFCPMHYERWRIHGNPQFTKYPRRFLGSAEVRFWANVDKPAMDGCWLWVASLKRSGYGHFWANGKQVLAHRFAYELLVGPIPEGLQIDHLCRTPACVNPAHLEAVTAKMNILRGLSVQAQNALKTHCPKGHPYDLFNTYYDPRGGRECRRCRRCKHERALSST